MLIGEIKDAPSGQLIYQLDSYRKHIEFTERLIRVLLEGEQADGLWWFRGEAGLGSNPELAIEFDVPIEVLGPFMREYLKQTKAKASGIKAELARRFNEE